MTQEGEKEKKFQEMGLTWWVRYAIVPVSVAVIAGLSAVKSAELLKPPAATQVVQTPASANPTNAITAPAPTEPPGAPASVLPPPTEIPPPTDTPTPTATPTPTEIVVGVPDILGEHIVRQGEHIYCIGRGYGVAPQAIVQANSLSSASLLYAGQVLVIPAAPWGSIPSGPVCARQFASPFPGGVEIAANPAPVEAQVDVQEPIDEPTATPTETPTETPTSAEPYPIGTEPPTTEPPTTEPPTTEPPTTEPPTTEPPTTQPPVVEITTPIP